MSELSKGWDREKGKLKITELPDMEALAAEAAYAIDEDAVAAANSEAMTKKEKAPYGEKVPYADDGMLPDGKKRYPIDCKHVKAAWSYSHQRKNASRYTPSQLARLHGKIAAAYKRCFGEEPPSLEKGK